MSKGKFQSRVGEKSEQKIIEEYELICNNQSELSASKRAMVVNYVNQFREFLNIKQ